MCYLMVGGVCLIGALSGAIHEAGRLSVYAPGDGFNRGILACGGEYTDTQEHIAHRRWHKYGCGSRVLILAEDTGRWAWTRIRDAGPFGIYKGPLAHARRDGRWKVWTKSLPPPTGWQWRAKVDLSLALWKKLGRPRFLSTIHLWIFPSRRPRGSVKPTS